jgi:hypothetical protein
MQAWLGENFVLVEMRCVFIFVLATLVTEKSGDICTTVDDAKCRSTQEYISKYSKGKAHT